MSDDSAISIEDVDPTSGELSDEEVAVLRAGLRSEHPIERREAARACKAVVVHEAEAIEPLLEDLAPLLEAERISVAQHAGTAMLGLAREDPVPLTEYVREVVSLSTRESDAIRRLGASILSAIVLERPAAAADEVHRLLPILREETGPYEASEAAEMLDDPQSRQSIVEHEQEEHRMRLEAMGILANVVVAVAEEDGTALADHVDELRVLVAHDDGTIAGTAVDAVAEVGRAAPDAAAPAFPELVAALDRDDRRIRVRAVRALGVLGDDRGVRPLRTLAESTDDDEVAELATETATFLAED